MATFQFTRIARAQIEEVDADRNPTGRLLDGFEVEFDVTTVVPSPMGGPDLPRVHVGNVYRWVASTPEDLRVKAQEVADHIEREEAKARASTVPANFAALVGG